MPHGKAVRTAAMPCFCVPLILHLVDLCSAEGLVAKSSRSGEAQILLASLSYYHTLPLTIESIPIMASEFMDVDPTHVLAEGGGRGLRRSNARLRKRGLGSGSRSKIAAPNLLEVPSQSAATNRLAKNRPAMEDWTTVRPQTPRARDFRYLFDQSRGVRQVFRPSVMKMLWTKHRSVPSLPASRARSKPASREARKVHQITSPDGTNVRSLAGTGLLCIRAMSAASIVPPTRNHFLKLASSLQAIHLTMLL